MTGSVDYMDVMVILGAMSHSKPIARGFRVRSSTQLTKKKTRTLTLIHSSCTKNYIATTNLSQNFVRALAGIKFETRGGVAWCYSV